MEQDNPESKRKGGGGRLSRSEIVTVRLDPKLRYLAELAARKQRRTVSSYVEWAVEKSFEKVELDPGGNFDGDDPKTIAGEAARLWVADESERFVKLAVHWPDLLNHDEQVMWKVLLDSGYLEPAKKRHATSRQIDWDWAILEDALFPALRRDWDSLLQAMGDGKSKEWIAATQTKLQSESRAAKAAPKSKAVLVKGTNRG